MAPIVPALGQFNVLGVERCRLGKYSCGSDLMAMTQDCASAHLPRVIVQAAVTADCCVHKGGHRPRARPRRDRGAMIVNGSLTDTEVSGDVLGGAPGKDEVQDLMLSIGQTRHPNGR